MSLAIPFVFETQRGYCSELRVQNSDLVVSKGLRREPDALPELCAVVELARRHNKPCRSNVANGLKWIRVQYDQVCPLTCFNDARLFVQFQPSGGHYRRGLDGFHGREPRIDVQLDFAMQAVSRDCLICAGNDRDARFVKCCEHVHPLIERRFCACRGTSGYAGVLQLCRELRCDLLNTWLEARNRVGT